MKIPIQARPIVRKLNTKKMTKTGIVASGDCWHCFQLNWLPFAPAFAQPQFICLDKCCKENPESRSCENYVPMFS